MCREDTRALHPLSFTAMAPSVTSRIFGTLADGRTVEAYTLRCAPLGAEVITLGAALRSLLVPDRNGTTADVVLGFDDLAGYADRSRYVGATVGRVAGRVPGASFVVDRRRYPLEANDGANHLHGGANGIDRKVWRANASITSDSASLQLSCTSEDGEGGYPGCVTIVIRYRLTAHALTISSDVTTTAITPVSLTHHSYFNLRGHGSGTVTDHQLAIFADTVVAVDDTMTLLGTLRPVDTCNDLRQPKLLDDVLACLHQHHGDLYRLPQADSSRIAARLIHPATGRVMEVITDEDYLQLYSGVSLRLQGGKDGESYGSYAGLCLECEGYPDGANTPALGSILVRPGEIQKRNTTYRFTVEG